MFKIRTYNQISVKGLERFPRQSYEVGSDIGTPHAFLLRSQKLQGVEVPKSLLAAARAGAGTNNVPIADYSKLGVVVFNTPGAHANARAAASSDGGTSTPCSFWLRSKNACGLPMSLPTSYD